MRLARLLQVSRIVQMPAHLPPAQSVGSTATISFRPRRDPQLVTELTGEDLVPELVVVILPAFAATLAICHYEWVIRQMCHFGGLPVFRLTSRHAGRLARRLIFALSAFAASFACRPRARKRPPCTGKWHRHKSLIRAIYRMFIGGLVELGRRRVRRRRTSMTVTSPTPFWAKPATNRPCGSAAWPTSSTSGPPRRKRW